MGPKRLLFLSVLVGFSYAWTEYQISDAIVSGATYVSNVVLDEKGGSRCDYHLMSGEWVAYEPAWHSGQAIYALVEAYKATNHSWMKKTAIRSAVWWLGLRMTKPSNMTGMIDGLALGEEPPV